MFLAYSDQFLAATFCLFGNYNNSREQYSELNNSQTQHEFFKFSFFYFPFFRVIRHLLTSVLRLQTQKSYFIDLTWKTLITNFSLKKTFLQNKYHDKSILRKTNIRLKVSTVTASEAGSSNILSLSFAKMELSNTFKT